MKKTIIILSTLLLIVISAPALAEELTETSSVFGGRYASIGEFIGETFIPYAVALASIAAVVMITIAGHIYLTSGGSPEAVNQAKEIIIGSLIGLAVIIMAGIFIQWIVEVNSGITLYPYPSLNTILSTSSLPKHLLIF
jgi:uncharacterized membrane protein